MCDLEWDEFLPQLSYNGLANDSGDKLVVYFMCSNGKRCTCKETNWSRSSSPYRSMSQESFHTAGSTPNNECSCVPTQIVIGQTSRTGEFQAPIDLLMHCGCDQGSSNETEDKQAFRQQKVINWLASDYRQTWELDSESDLASRASYQLAPVGDNDLVLSKSDEESFHTCALNVPNVQNDYYDSPVARADHLPKTDPANNLHHYYLTMCKNGEVFAKGKDKKRKDDAVENIASRLVSDTMDRVIRQYSATSCQDQENNSRITSKSPEKGTTTGCTLTCKPNKKCHFQLDKQTPDQKLLTESETKTQSGVKYEEVTIQPAKEYHVNCTKEITKTCTKEITKTGTKEITKTCKDSDKSFTKNTAPGITDYATNPEEMPRKQGPEAQTLQHEKNASNSASFNSVGKKSDTSCTSSDYAMLTLLASEEHGLVSSLFSETDLDQLQKKKQRSGNATCTASLTEVNDGTTLKGEFEASTNTLANGPADVMNTMENIEHMEGGLNFSLRPKGLEGLKQLAATAPDQNVSGKQVEYSCIKDRILKEKKSAGIIAEEGQSSARIYGKDYWQSYAAAMGFLETAGEGNLVTSSSQPNTGTSLGIQTSDFDSIHFEPLKNKIVRNIKSPKTRLPAQLTRRNTCDVIITDATKASNPPLVIEASAGYKNVIVQPKTEKQDAAIQYSVPDTTNQNSIVNSGVGVTLCRENEHNTVGWSPKHVDTEPEEEYRKIAVNSLISIFEQKKRF